MQDRVKFLKSIALDLINGAPYVDYEDGYKLENLVINRKKPVNSRIQISLVKEEKALHEADMQIALRFCQEISDVYNVRKYDVNYKKSKGEVSIYINLEIGFEKNTDQLTIDDGGIDPSKVGDSGIDEVEETNSEDLNFSDDGDEM